MGNKSDNHPLADVASARVSTHVVYMYLQEMKNCTVMVYLIKQHYADEDEVAYFSVSAKDGSLVQEAFLTLISEVMKARNSEYQISHKVNIISYCQSIVCMCI